MFMTNASTENHETLSPGGLVIVIIITLIMVRLSLEVATWSCLQAFMHA
jgi:hypothetical protein